MENILKSDTNPFVYLFKMTIFLILCSGILIFFKGWGGSFLFVIIEFYFIAKKNVLEVIIEEDKIKVLYFSFFVKKYITSNINKVKIQQTYEMASYRNAEKKYTLLIFIDRHKFSVNKLDGFDEDDIKEFYEEYLANHKNIEK